METSTGVFDNFLENHIVIIAAGESMVDTLLSEVPFYFSLSALYFRYTGFCFCFSWSL